MCRRTMQGDNNKVQFKLPDYVKITSDEFDGQPVTIEYDSNFGGDVEVSGEAELDTGDYPSDYTHLVVDGRYVRSNGHVFNDDGRHLGKVESVTATVDKDVGIELVTAHVDHDVDCGDDEIIVQTWDDSVIEERGFMAGTDSIRMERV